MSHRVRRSLILIALTPVLALAGSAQAGAAAGRSATPAGQEFSAPATGTGGEARTVLGRRVITKRAAGSKPSRAKRSIIGGSVITIDQAPWQARVWGEGWSCGGSILAADKILTAAHCLDDTSPGQAYENGGVFVSVGTSRNDTFAAPGTPVQDRMVASATKHPLWKPYTPTTVGDVAVLKLAGAPLTLGNGTAQAVALPTPGVPQPADALTGTALVATGWGVSTFGVDPDALLRRITPSIADPDFCGEDYNATFVCGQTPTGSTCQGDSGGPIVLPPAAPGVAPVQVGIVSNGPNGCPAGARDMYTNLWAPEVRHIVDGLPGTPPTAPRLGAADAVLRAPASMRVGDAVDCAPASFTGAASVETKISTDDGAVLASAVGGPASFVLTPAQVGRTVRCRSYGTSPGGVAVSYIVGFRTPVAAAPVTVPPPAVVTPPVGTGVDGLCTARTVNISISAPKKVRRGKKLVITASIADSDLDATAGRASLQVKDRGRYRTVYTANLKRNGARVTARFVHLAKRSGRLATFTFRAELETTAARKRCERGTSKPFKVRFTR